MNVFHIGSGAELEDLQDRAWAEDVASKRSVCTLCLKPNGSESVDVVLTRRPDGIVQPTWFAEVVHRTLFEYLRPHLQGANVGAVYVRKRGRLAVLDEYVSCVTMREYSPIVHGYDDAKFNWCPQCDWISLAYPGTDGGVPAESYLVESEIGARQAIQFETYCQFFISRAMKESVPWNDLPPVELHPTPVLERAMDLRRMPHGSNPNLYIIRTSGR